MRIILSGYMGAGKTGVGKIVSKKLNLPFLDLDTLICEAENRSIPDIFRDSGEIYFRRKEAEILKQTLKKDDRDFILSLGGGTPCYGRNLEVIKDSENVIMVYLKTSLEELTTRLMREKEERPVIKHLGTEELLMDFIRKHLFERSYYYNQSDIILNTDSKSMENLAVELIEKLN